REALETELARRREEAERADSQRHEQAKQETARPLADAQEHASAAEARVAAALQKAEEIRSKAEEQAARTLADARGAADRITQEAKQGSELLRSETSAKVERERRTAQRELDELNQQRESITTYLDELRGLLGDGDDSAVNALMADRKSTRLNSSHVSISYAV